MIEYKGCEICNGSKYFYTEDPKNPGMFVATPCKCYIKYLHDRRLEILTERSGLSLDILNYDISSYYGDRSKDNVSKLKDFIENFTEYKSSSIYFYGKKSTQKSTLSKWVARELIDKGHSVYYVLMDVLLKDLCNEQFLDKKDIETRNRIRAYKTSDFLVIDESFKKERVLIYKSNYQITFIDSFLRERLESKKLSTLFVSNAPIEDIEKEGYNEYIQEIINRNCFPLFFDDSINIEKIGQMSNLFAKKWSDKK